jgi:hypothetical protein
MKTKKNLILIFLIFPILCGNAQIKVDSYGKVGIGTLSPSSLLNVHGASQNIEISNTAQTEAGILFNDYAYKSTQYAKILFNSGNNSLNFYVNNTTPRLTVTSSGNFGFGTTSPSGKIHIGTDGEAAGLYFYNASTGGSSFRIYRKNDWGYITRAGDDGRGFRIDPYGSIKLYVNNK